MNRKFKALGVALLGVLAMSAVAASSASAVDTFTAGKPNVVVTGTSEGKGVFKATGAGLEAKCTTGRFSATVLNGSSSATAFATYEGKKDETPHKANCETNGFGDIIAVDMNGCDYKLTGETSGVDVGTDATVWVICPVNKEIQLTSSLCTIEIPEQTPTSGGVSYTNEGTTKLKIKATVTGLKYTVHGPFCSLAFGSTTTWHDGDYNDEVVVEGFEDNGAGTNPDEFKEGSGVTIQWSAT